MYKYKVKNDMYTCICTPGAYKINTDYNDELQ